MLGFRRIKRVFSLYLFFDFEMKQLCVFFLSFSSFFFFLFFLKRYLVDIDYSLRLYVCVLSFFCVHSYR